jgi:hypothetical protein
MLKVLAGHTSPETAYVVEDYPYGFRLRCKIRYWIETKKGHGQRFCSQTTNPKIAGEHWNKPKCGTYSVLLVLVAQDDPKSDQYGYVSTVGLQSGGWSKEEDIQAFEQKYAEGIGDYERKAIQYIRATNFANDHIKYEISPASNDPNHVPQTHEEQEAIWNAAVRQGYAQGVKDAQTDQG